MLLSKSQMSSPPPPPPMSSETAAVAEGEALTEGDEDTTEDASADNSGDCCWSKLWRGAVAVARWWW